MFKSQFKSRRRTTVTTDQDIINPTSVVQLDAPRFENGKALLIAGLRRRYISKTMESVRVQWQRFAPHIGNVPGQVGRAAYGLCFNTTSPGIDYLSGVEVLSCANLPGEFSCISIPAQRYASFLHREHVSRVWDTCDAIGKQWFPASGHELARASGDAPDFFERYTEAFDPRTGMGGIEVWIPIKS
jgi:AraC family transcriptional regulator